MFKYSNKGTRMTLDHISHFILVLLLHAWSETSGHTFSQFSEIRV